MLIDSIARGKAFTGRRVPFIQQQSDLECGLACMAMVLSTFGRATSISELREQHPVGRDGMSSKHMLEIAAAYGLAAKAYSTDRLDLEVLQHPLVVHWSFSHWVVVEKSAGRYYRIIDPSRGRRKVSREEFSKHFTGIVLRFRPTEEFVRRRRSRPLVTWAFLRRTIAEINGYRLLALVALCSVVLQALALCTAVAVKTIVDAVLPRALSTALPLMGLALLLMTAVNLTLGLLRSLIMVRFRTMLDVRAMSEVLGHLLKLPFSFFQARSRGDLLSRVTGFASLRQTVAENGVTTVLDGVFAIGYLFWILKLSPVLAAMIGFLALCQVGALVATSSIQTRCSRAIYVASADQTTSLVDVLSGIEYLKASGSEVAAWNWWNNLLRGEISAVNRRAYLNVSLNVVSGMCHVGGPFLVLWYGTKLVLAGALTPGAMLSISALVGSVFWPLANCVNAVQQLQAASAHLERLDDVLAAPVEMPAGSSAVSNRLQGSIEVMEAGFTYAGAARPALEGVSLRVEPGEVVGLAGSTGSGKSTLAMLLVGLLEPSHGKIYFDGLEPSHYERNTLRRQIGYVPQMPLLFRGSLRDNIAFGCPEASLDDIREACRLASVHEEIEALPLGYETLVSEQGLNFSGGQRQRIAIARALLRRPRILVMDEATSHLDSETERKVNSMLAGLACTRILIAHRLSTIRSADRVLVVESGRVIEAGPPQDLLQRNGRYALMVKAQMEARIA